MDTNKNNIYFRFNLSFPCDKLFNGEKCTCLLFITNVMTGIKKIIAKKQKAGKAFCADLATSISNKMILNSLNTKYMCPEIVVSWKRNFYMCGG